MRVCVSCVDTHTCSCDRRANQLLTDSSLELTAQLRAIERDRMGLVSQLKDRKRQIAMVTLWYFVVSLLINVRLHGILTVA